MKAKVFSTTLAYMLMLGLSFTYSTLGPCLLDLASLYSIPPDMASTIFLWRGIGGLTGNLVCGRLYDMLRESVILIPSLFVGAAVTAAIPWASLYPVVSVLYGLQGFTMSSLSLCSHLLLLRNWGRKNGPFLQGLHLMYPIAALIAPLVVQPFLMERTISSVNVTNTPDAGDVNVTNTSDTGDVIRDLVPFNESLLTPAFAGYTFNHSIISTRPMDSQPGRSMLYFVFIINTGLLLLLALISFIQVWFDPHIKRSKTDNETDKDPLPVKKRAFEKCLWLLFILSALCLGSLENGYSGLLFTFVVKYLDWSKSKSTFLLTISSTSSAVGRLIGILASSFIKPKIILGVDYVLILASVLCLIFLVHLHPMVVWVCCSVLPLGRATVFAANITWARDFFHVSGVFTSFYLIGYSVGALSGPPLIGYLFTHLHELWYCYLLLIYVGLMLLLYAVLLFLHCFICHKPEELILNIPETKAMLDETNVKNNHVTS